VQQSCVCRAARHLAWRVSLSRRPSPSPCPLASPARTLCARDDQECVAESCHSCRVRRRDIYIQAWRRCIADTEAVLRHTFASSHDNSHRLGLPVSSAEWTGPCCEAYSLAWIMATGGCCRCRWLSCTSGSVTRITERNQHVTACPTEGINRGRESSLRCMCYLLR